MRSHRRYRHGGTWAVCSQLDRTRGSELFSELALPLAIGRFSWAFRLTHHLGLTVPPQTHIYWLTTCLQKDYKSQGCVVLRGQTGLFHLYLRPCSDRVVVRPRSSYVSPASPLSPARALRLIFICSAGFFWRGSHSFCMHGLSREIGPFPLPQDRESASVEVPG